MICFFEMAIDNKKKSIDWVGPVKIAARLSSWIIFPVIAGFLLGSYLDNKYDSSPKWFLIVIGVSFFISMFGLVKNTIEEYKKIENNNKNIVSKEKKD